MSNRYYLQPRHTRFWMGVQLCTTFGISLRRFGRPWREHQLTVSVYIVIRFQVGDGPQIIRHLFYFNFGESTFTSVHVTAGIVRSSDSIFPFVAPVSVWVSSIASPSLSGSGLPPESGSS